MTAVETIDAQVVILSNKSRTVVRLIDYNRYRERNKVEYFFSRLKQLRRLATRHKKMANSFPRMVHFVSAPLWLHQLSVQPRTGRSTGAESVCN